MTLSDSFGELMKFIAYTVEESITKQHLDTCLNNATCVSITSDESIVEEMNFYFETKILIEINDARLYHYMLAKQIIHLMKNVFQRL